MSPKKPSRRVAIVDGLRTPFAKSGTVFRDESTLDLANAVVAELVARTAVDAATVDQIVYGSDPIDLRGVEQLVDSSQTRAVGLAIHLATQRFMDGRATLAQVLDCLDAFFDEHGLDPLDPFHRREHHPGNLARPRRFEIAAAINRLRTVRMRQTGPGEGGAR